jgi:hypothetical protein
MCGDGRQCADKSQEDASRKTAGSSHGPAGGRCFQHHRGQKLNSFLIAPVIGSWVITFFDGFEMNVISFAAPYIIPELHLDKMMMGKLFSIGLTGTMVGGFPFGY